MRDLRGLVMLMSIIVACLMLVGKLTAFALSGSAALLADASESIVHLAATVFAAFGLWYANQPADANHPYGHGKVAFLSAGFEGALVFIAATAVISGSAYDLWRGPEIERPGVGLAIAVGLTVINLSLGVTLLKVGKSHNSIVLEANGKHVLTDVFTTVAAILGLGLVATTGWQPFDPLVAMLIGVLIMVSGIRMIRASIAGLMDELPPDLRARLNRSLQESVQDGTVAQFHAVRARRVDNQLWLEMHLLIPGTTSVLVAHNAATKVERKLQTDFPEFHVRASSHIEPVEHLAAHPDDTP